jgi:1-acyl-sn-glycerol-3-phosphate acyltransferase
VSDNGSDYSRGESDPMFRLLKAAAGIYSRVYHESSLKRPFHLPRSGPAILVCNHIGSIDPILIQAYCPRLIRWMMAKEYFKYRSMRWVFEAVGVILVERSGRDMAATRAAMRALDAGYVLGVFPEGKIGANTNRMLPFQSGIGLLALKTRAPVYPAYLDGGQRNREMIEAFLHPSNATLAVGEPLDLSDLADSRQGVLEATRRIESAVKALSDGRERNGSEV